MGTGRDAGGGVGNVDKRDSGDVGNGEDAGGVQAHGDATIDVRDSGEARASDGGTSSDFIVAADVSEAKQAQDHGVVFLDTDGTPGHYMDILKKHGFNMMIVRVT